MGYCMEMVEANFTIKSQHRVGALKAIKAMADVVDERGSGGGGRWGEPQVKWYSWMNGIDFSTFRSLPEAMQAWRWPVEVTGDEAETGDPGDIIGIDFVGEKLGDDAQLFQAIAPFVESGSYIRMRGEDGTTWEYRFRNGVMKEVQARLVWDDDDDEEATEDWPHN